MHKERRWQSPNPPVHKIVEAEDEVLLSKHGRLLPSPDASNCAADYQERVDFQRMVRVAFFSTLPYLAALFKKKRGPGECWFPAGAYQLHTKRPL